MAGYIGSKVAVVSSGAERKKVFTATSGQTSFTGLSYTVNNVHVFQNGVRLVDGTDYTATDGNSITLTVGAATDDQVVVVSYNTFQTSDTVSASTGGTFSNAVTIDADGSTVLTVDRATSDGTIIDLHKGGSSVGVIGSGSSRLTIGDGATGLRFVDASTDRISPWNLSTNTDRDNAIDLGESGGRFKDLYLSGGVVFGDAGGSGTPTSNTLNSYEEGTWTPSVTSGTVSTARGSYVKVGDLVTATGIIGGFSDTTTTNDIQCSVPFTSAAGDNKQAHGSVMSQRINFGTSFLTAYLNDNSNNLSFYINSPTSTWSGVDHNDVTGSSAFLRFTITYRAV